MNIFPGPCSTVFRTKLIVRTGPWSSSVCFQQQPSSSDRFTDMTLRLREEMARQPLPRLVGGRAELQPQVPPSGPEGAPVACQPNYLAPECHLPRLAAHSPRTCSEYLQGWGSHFPSESWNILNWVSHWSPCDIAYGLCSQEL